jgi:hypothetical protein
MPPVGPLVYEGNIPVTLIPADPDTGWQIANLNAPTVAELATGTTDDGVRVDSYIPKNGVTFPSNRNMVDTSAIDREANSEYPGSRGGTLQITFKVRNRDGDSAAYELLKSGKVPVDIVFGFEGSNGTADDLVDIYRAVGHTPVRNNPGPDEEQRFTVSFGIQDDALGVEVVSGS